LSATAHVHGVAERGGDLLAAVRLDVAAGVARLHDKVARLAGNHRRRRRGGALLRKRLARLDERRERRVLDVLALAEHVELVLARLGDNVGARVGAVLVVLDGDLDLLLAENEQAGDVGAADLDALALVVLELDGVAGLAVRLGLGEAGTVGERLGGAGGVLGLVAAEVRDVGHDRELVGRLDDVDGVEQLRKVEVLLGGAERVVERRLFARRALAVDGAQIKLLRAAAVVDEALEGGAVLPVGGEVVDVLALRIERAVAPVEQVLLDGVLAVVLLLDLLDLEAQNQRPDEAENQLLLLLKHVLGRDVHELDLLVAQKLEREVEILHLLHFHLHALLRLGLDVLARQNLEQIEQQHTVRQIFVEFIDFQITCNKRYKSFFES
jgi:hypothetical protein